MALSLRKQKILKVLVSRYIKTGQAVSSQDIKNNLDEDISPATIRSELSALEEMGYLEQPHVSAGRIPTTKAYKLYIDALPTTEPSERANYVEELRSFFEKKMDEVEDVVKSTAKVISDVTNYTSVIVVKNIEKVVIRTIKLIDIGADSALVIIITDSGVIKDSIIDLPKNIGSSYLATACEILNNLFDNKSIEEVIQSDVLLSEELAQYKQLLQSVIDLMETLGEKEGEVFVEGTAKLLNYPEYEDKESIQSILSLIDRKKDLSEMVSSAGLEVSVKIGADEGIEHGSLVSVNYRLDDKHTIHAGVIGPQRMDYKKVIDVLTHLEEAIKSINGKKED